MDARASLEMRLLWGFSKSPFGFEPDTPGGRNPSTCLGWSHAGGKSSKCCCRPVFNTMVFSTEDLKGLRRGKKKKRNQLQLKVRTTEMEVL